jgi:hypothetical protein
MALCSHLCMHPVRVQVAMSRLSLSLSLATISRHTSQLLHPVPSCPRTPRSQCSEKLYVNARRQSSSCPTGQAAAVCSDRGEHPSSTHFGVLPWCGGAVAARGAAAMLCYLRLRASDMYAWSYRCSAWSFTTSSQFILPTAA